MYSITSIKAITNRYKMETSREQALRDILPGWHELVNSFYDAVDDWNLKHSDNLVIVTDIKQKWGDLRISFTPQIKELSDLYSTIKKKSGTICEICGCPGKHTDMDYNGSHWMYVLCKKHKKQHPIDYFEREYY